MGRTWNRAELGAIKGHISVQVLKECRKNLAKKPPSAIAPFEKIVQHSLSLASNQADKKYVPILASALGTKACFLVTFNVKDYWPHGTIGLEVLTPGELLSRIRLAFTKLLES